jgi:hypothetical protein
MPSVLRAMKEAQGQVFNFAIACKDRTGATFAQKAGGFHGSASLFKIAPK